MQQGLKDKGYYKGNVDGVWGSGTSSALSAFKSATGGSNSSGNSFGKETTDKLYGTNSSGTKSSGAKGGIGFMKNVIKSVSNNPTAYGTAYYNALTRGGMDPIGSDKLTADPNIQNQWNMALGGAQDLYNTNAGQLGNVYNQGVNQANQAAEDAARQQYIVYKQNKNKLAEQLSSSGITGGASETALNSILNAYASGLASNNSALQESLAKLGNEYQGDLSSLMAQLQQSQAAINNQYGQMQAEDLANQKKQLAESQASMLEAYLQREQQKKINDWNSRVSSNIQSKNPTWVYTDTNGRLHYTNSQATAAAAKAQGYKVVENKKKNSTTKKSTKKNSKSQSKDGSDYSSIWGNTGSNGDTKSKYVSMKKYKSLRGM
nr:MAG TPA: Adenosylhomocysteinase [Caudoviricetes sp.]